jgi:chemotaxis methyl-accepting protein methylase
MKSDGQLEHVLDNLLAYAAEWNGFQVESVTRQAVKRALEHELARGATLQDVMRRAAAKDRELMRIVREAVGVRETYFFRHPEHFELVASRVAGLAAGGVVRAWSAGCATGEETWSLAATIAACAPGRKANPQQMLIVGTDVHEPGLETARAGVYRSGSQRPSGPLLHPVVTARGDRLHVLDELRLITSFAQHDLREPPPGEFELIFCRNVLIYFTRQSALTILGHLASALVPGGLLVFGTMDVDPADIPQLARVGRSELMVFTTRPTERKRNRPMTLNVPTLPEPPPSPILPPQALALHRSALMWVELGGRASAEKVLHELNRQFPDYVPGIMERALSHIRKGDHANALTWMKDVLRRTEGRHDDELVLGLEELPVSFYRDAARAYVERAEKSEKGDRS